MAAHTLKLKASNPNGQEDPTDDMVENGTDPEIMEKIQQNLRNLEALTAELCLRTPFYEEGPTTPQENEDHRTNTILATINNMVPTAYLLTQEINVQEDTEEPQPAG